MKYEHITGLAINVIDHHDDSFHITCREVWLINVNPSNDWAPMFKTFFPTERDIALHFLVRLKYEKDSAFNGMIPYVKSNATVIRYGTHEYDVATVLGKSYDGNTLRLYGEKLGEITYDIANSPNYSSGKFIRNDDKLLIKFPNTIGQHIQIIDNISHQQRKVYFKEHDCFRPFWANDYWLPKKYTISPDGILLKNKREKGK